MALAPTQTKTANAGGTAQGFSFDASVASDSFLTLTIMFWRTDGGDPSGMAAPTMSGRGTWVLDKDTNNGFIRAITYHCVVTSAGTAVTITFASSVQAVVHAAEWAPNTLSASLTQPETTYSTAGTSKTVSVQASTTRGRALLWGAGSASVQGGGSPPADKPVLTATLTASGLYVEAANSGRIQVVATVNTSGRLATAYREAAGPGTFATGWSLVTDVYAGGTTPLWLSHGVAYQLIGPAAALAGETMGAGEAFAMLTAVHSDNIPASPVALPERWFVRPPGDATWTDLSSFAYLVARAEGADAHPPLRGQDAPWTSREGRQWLRKLADGRTLPLLLYVQPTNAAGTLIEPTARRQTRVNLDALHRILAVRSQLELMRVMPDGNGRVAAAEVASVQPITDTLSGVIVGLMVDFFLADPWFYGLNVVDVRTISASPTDFTITNPGDVPGDFLLIEMLGALTNPRLVNLRTGHDLLYTGALTSSKRLIYNVRAGTARVNGASVLADLTRYSPPGRAEFFALEPGVNSLRLTASATGGELALTLRPPFV